jgi:anaerobic selenocysteine-containing dehydrogenase
MNEGPALKEQKKKYGPESLAILSPARRSYSEYLYRFLIAHGSPNYGHSGICAMQKTFAFTYTLGAAPWPDIPQSNLILIWGKQPVYSGSTRGNLKQILDARERGAKIIAIKPTMEPDVAIADQWIPIRPGTDAALALALDLDRLRLHHLGGLLEHLVGGIRHRALHLQRRHPDTWSRPEGRARRTRAPSR